MADLEPVIFLAFPGGTFPLLPVWYVAQAVDKIPTVSRRFESFIIFLSMMVK